MEAQGEDYDEEDEDDEDDEDFIEFDDANDGDFLESMQVPTNFFPIDHHLSELFLRIESDWYSREWKRKL
jgi:hypothetical protein